MRHGLLLAIFLTLFCGTAAADPPRNCAPRVALEATAQELRHSWPEFVAEFRTELRQSLQRAHAPGSQIQLSPSQNRLVEFLMEQGTRIAGGRVSEFGTLVRSLEPRLAGPNGFKIARVFMTPEGRVLAVPWGSVAPNGSTPLRRILSNSEFIRLLADGHFPIAEPGIKLNSFSSHSGMVHDLAHLVGLAEDPDAALALRMRARELSRLPSETLNHSTFRDRVTVAVEYAEDIRIGAGDDLSLLRIPAHRPLARITVSERELAWSELRTHSPQEFTSHAREVVARIRRDTSLTSTRRTFGGAAMDPFYSMDAHSSHRSPLRHLAIQATRDPSPRNLAALETAYIHFSQIRNQDWIDLLMHESPDRRSHLAWVFCHSGLSAFGAVWNRAAASICD